MTKLECCIEEIRSFLLQNKLCNNGDKTEFLLIGSLQQLKKVKTRSLKVGDLNVKAVEKAKNLGVIFDKHMSMDKQVNKMCSNAYYNIRNIAKIKKSLGKNELKTVVHALVTPHLDYGNGLLQGISKRLLDKLQVAQNSAVRLIEGIDKYESVTTSRKNLHWLPIPARIEFKQLVLTWKILSGESPEYLKKLINKNEGNDDYQLRSNQKSLLILPNNSSTNSYTDRAFATSAPTLWNPLPEYVKNKESLLAFKKSLKSHLFRKFY